jgi:predicted TIM-barrel fold metal-dependent hydrolase
MKKLLSISVLMLVSCPLVFLVVHAQQRQMREPGLQDTLLLKDYRPQSIFNVPKTNVLRAKYAAIDMHMHAPRANTDLDKVAGDILKNMDACNIRKTILFCGTGKMFDTVAAVFAKYPDRFELWCGLDFSGFPASTVAELRRCVKAGARGVGEISDKGTGYRGVEPMHLDDARMDPILEEIADLGLPMNVHMGDPQWMYEPMDATNDLLFEALFWRRDDKKDDKDLAGMLQVLEHAVRKHPRVKFIACHFANQTFDLNRLGRLFDKYPNLYADCSQRESYLAAIPRFGKQFIEKYADRIVYGTDQGYSLPMYRNSFHIWESLDEHFYAWDVANTRFALSGLGLSDATLRKLYHDNAIKLLKKE